MRKKKLLKAIKPLVSEEMERHLSDFPDDTPVRLEVSGRNGYGLMITLKEMRELWAAIKAI